ncbi:MAG: hypothetical protein QXL38_02495 [Candidatus Bathyarchaeia archaeon]
MAMLHHQGCNTFEIFDSKNNAFGQERLAKSPTLTSRMQILKQKFRQNLNDALKSRAAEKTKNHVYDCLSWLKFFCNPTLIQLAFQKAEPAGFTKWKTSK